MTKYAYALPPRGFSRRAYVVVSTEDQIATLTGKRPLGKVEMTEAMTFERLEEALKPIAQRGSGPTTSGRRQLATLWRVKASSGPPTRYVLSAAVATLPLGGVFYEAGRTARANG